MELFPYQKTGTEWLSERTACILADQQRLGKTVQVLRAAKPGAPILVICPAVARTVWEDETKVWRPDLKCYRMEKRGSFRWPKPGELGAVSYELTPPAFESPPPGTIVVLDEAHRCRRDTSGVSKRAEAISHACRARSGKVWCLTGTPIMNYPGELWNMLGILQSRNLVFGWYGEFLKCFGAYESAAEGKVEWGEPDASVPDRLARIMLRRLRSQVMPELPKRTIQTVRVPLSGNTTLLCDGAYAAIRKRGFSLWEAYEHASKRGRASWPELSRALSAIAIAKLPAVLQMIEDYEMAKEPLVVVSAHRGPVDAIATRPGWGAISGDVSPKRRQDVMRDFKDGKLKGVVCSTLAAGVAIDLSTAAHIIMLDCDWSPGNNDQAADRIEGPKQTRPTTCIFTVTDHPVERHLLDLLAQKEYTISKVVVPMERTA